MNPHTGTGTAPMRVSGSVALIPASVEAVWPSLTATTGALFPAETVVAHPGELLIQSLPADAHLVWDLVPVSPAVTRVRVTLCEPADGAPEPELDLLLCSLVRHAVTSAAEVEVR